MRTIIDIPDQLVESLDRVGKTHQKSRAALVREAITDFLREKSIPQAEAAFGKDVSPTHSHIFGKMPPHTKSSLLLDLLNVARASRLRA